MGGKVSRDSNSSADTVQTVSSGSGPQEARPVSTSNGVSRSASVPVPISSQEQHKGSRGSGREKEEPFQLAVYDRSPLKGSRARSDAKPSSPTNPDWKPGLDPDNHQKALDWCKEFGVPGLEGASPDTTYWAVDPHQEDPGYKV